MSDRPARSLTFYIAASSADVPLASACMRDMEALGLSNAMDWTRCIGAPEYQWPQLATGDIDAARDADVFVLLTGGRRVGASGLLVELGARLSAGRAVHLVGGRWHFFMHHPLVVHHRDWRVFVESSEGRAS